MRLCACGVWDSVCTVYMCVGAARRGCLGPGTRVHVYAGVVCGAGFEGVSAAICAPLGVPQWAPRPWSRLLQSAPLPKTCLPHAHCDPATLGAGRGLPKTPTPCTQPPAPEPCEGVQFCPQHLDPHLLGQITLSCSSRAGAAQGSWRLSFLILPNQPGDLEGLEGGRGAPSTEAASTSGDFVCACCPALPLEDCRRVCAPYPTVCEGLAWGRGERDGTRLLLLPTSSLSPLPIT